MFRGIAINLVIAAIQKMLCQMYGICLSDENCPDGVCDEALQALDSLDTDAPSVAVAPGVTQSAGFELNWDKLQPLVQATVAFIKALREFVGLDGINVGG